MTHPGEELVVARGIHLERTAAKAFHEPAKFDGCCCGLRRWREGIRTREQPDRATEELGFGMRGAAYLFACHGVSGQKARAARPVIVLGSSLGDLLLGAAYIGDELLWAEDLRQPAHPF